jgi:hypothetical protein
MTTYYKTALSVLLVCCFAACGRKKDSPAGVPDKPEKKIEVLVNRNEVAFRIAHHLAETNKDYARPNPVRDTLDYYFKDYLNYPVIETLRKEDIGYDDVVSQYLLHQKEFPDFGNLYNDSITINEMELDGYVGIDTLYARIYSELYDFFKEANVEKFLEEIDYWYSGAVDEIKYAASQYDVIQQMEEYCRLENYRYVVSPEPLFITGGWRGIGPTIYTENGKICYQLISPSPNIDLQDVDYNAASPEYGYADNSYIRTILVHEFGHSFVKLDLGIASNQAFLDEKSHLFTEAVQEPLSHTGVGDFHTYIVEHIVRLLEIRIADIYIGAKEAQELRDANTAFIWLPQMEKLIISEYESKPNSYENLDAFIPELLSVVE